MNPSTYDERTTRAFLRLNESRVHGPIHNAFNAGFPRRNSFFRKYSSNSTYLVPSVQLE
jgi:hypothetical protein